MIIHPIQKELIDITGFIQEDEEQEQDFLYRIVKYVSTDLPDEEWDDLSEPAQEWVNKYVRAIKQRTIPPKLPIDIENKTVVVPTNASTKTTKLNGAEVDVKIKKRRKGGSVKLKRIMLDNPDISAADLAKKLSDEGVVMTKSTINSYWSDMRTTLALLKERGIELPKSVRLPKNVK
jgi:hypothetical protein